MSCAASLAERRLIAGWLSEWRQPHALRNPLRLGLPSQLAHALYLGRSHLGRSHLGRAHLGRAHSAGENNGHTRLGVHMGGGLRGLLSQDGSRALWSLACFFACLLVLCLCLFASSLVCLYCACVCLLQLRDELRALLGALRAASPEGTAMAYGARCGPVRSRLVTHTAPFSAAARAVPSRGEVCFWGSSFNGGTTQTARGLP